MIGIETRRKPDDIDRTFLLVPAQQYIGGFLAAFKEFPPSQNVGSFSLDQALETLQERKQMIPRLIKRRYGTSGLTHRDGGAAR